MPAVQDLVKEFCCALCRKNKDIDLSKLMHLRGDFLQTRVFFLKIAQN